MNKRHSIVTMYLPVGIVAIGLFALFTIVALHSWSRWDCSESYSTRVDNPIVLVGPFLSYQRVAEVRRLVAPPAEWRMTEDYHLPPSDPRPSFDTYKAVVANLTLLGQAGDVVLDFTNDRLFKVSFYPDSPREFRPVLSAAMELSSHSEVASLAVKVTKDSDGSIEFVSWEDQRLYDDISRWIRCNA